MNIELLMQELTVSTPTTVTRAKRIRIYNDSASDTLLTLKDGLGEIKGSMTIPNGAITYIVKESDWTIESVSPVKATAVAFRA